MRYENGKESSDPADGARRPATGICGVFFRLFDPSLLIQQKIPPYLTQCGSPAVCEESEVANLVKALRENVREKSSYEFRGFQGHLFNFVLTLFVPFPVVPAGETDFPAICREDAMVAYGYPMGVAPHVANDPFGAAEGGFREDHEFRSSQGFKKLRKTLRRDGALPVGGKVRAPEGRPHRALP